MSKCQACRKGEANLVAKVKVQKSTSSTTVQNGKKSDGGFQVLAESGSKKQEPQSKSGSGKEVLLRILSVEAIGTGPIQYERGRVREAEELEYASRRLLRAMLQQTGLFWVPLESGEHVVGRRGWIVVENWGVFVRCTARTIKRAELTVYFCLLKKVMGPIKVHDDNK